MKASTAIGIAVASIGLTVALVIVAKRLAKPASGAAVQPAPQPAVKPPAAVRPKPGAELTQAVEGAAATIVKNWASGLSL